jgi:WD40 repeat protein
MERDVTALAWSPDSQHFVAGDSVGTVGVWTMNGQQVYRNDVPKRATQSSLSLAWSPDGKYLAIGGSGFVELCRAKDGTSLATYAIAGSGIAWSPDGKRIASGDSGPGEIHIWEPDNGHIQRTLHAYVSDDEERVVDKLAWSPDSTYIAALGPHAGDFLALWNTITGEATLLPFNEPFDTGIYDILTAIAWSPDGKRIAAGYSYGVRGRVALWSRHDQLGTWQFDGSLSAHFLLVYGIAWSPDSSRFATIGHDNTIQIWSAFSMKLLNSSIASAHNAVNNSSYLQALGWSPDGTYLLVGDTVGQIWLWAVR